MIFSDAGFLGALRVINATGMKFNMTMIEFLNLSKLAAEDILIFFFFFFVLFVVVFRENKTWHFM